MAALWKLSNHLMDWLKVWHNTQMKNFAWYVVSFYLFQWLHIWIHNKQRKGGQSFTHFLLKKQYLLRVDIPTLIAPYVFAKHWNVFVLNKEYSIYFDSIWAAKLHAKFWATWRRFQIGTVKWKSYISLDILEYPCIP